MVCIIKCYEYCCLSADGFTGFSGDLLLESRCNSNVIERVNNAQCGVHGKTEAGHGA